VQRANSPSRIRTRLLAVGLASVASVPCGGLLAVSARASSRAHRHTTASPATATRSQAKRCHSGRGRRSKRACPKPGRAGGVHTSSHSGTVVAKPGSTEGTPLSIQSAPPAEVLTSQGPSGSEGGSGSPEGAPGPSAGSEGGSGSPPAGGGSSPPEGGSGSLGGSTPTEPPPSNPPEPTTPFRFFASTSVWNEPVPASAALDPNSTALVGELDSLIAAEEQAGDGPWINTTSYSYPIYTVPANQPTVKVQLTGSTNAPLSSAWSAVPLPPNAEPAVGTDSVLVVWQPSTDRLWEFWRLKHEPAGWQASWGGAMQHTSSDSGVYGPEAWPGAQTWWGTSASSMSVAGGLITLEDLQKGEINHALAIVLPERRASVYASPAQRTDGKSTNPLSLPEGAHLRLNPNLNLAALHLPHLTLLLAKAAQRYGIFVTDGGAVAGFYAQDPTPTGTNPYAGPGGYFEGVHPSQLLASFPWSQLELLEMELHSTS
jgi:hypothetical protein